MVTGRHGRSPAFLRPVTWLNGRRDTTRVKHRSNRGPMFGRGGRRETLSASRVRPGLARRDRARRVAHAGAFWAATRSPALSHSHLERPMLHHRTPTRLRAAIARSTASSAQPASPNNAAHRRAHVPDRKISAEKRSVSSTSRRFERLSDEPVRELCLPSALVDELRTAAGSASGVT
jgi:hypothetical protein